MQEIVILIIGAGLGGLALAQGLVQSGFKVSVYERDASPTSRAQGYRISIRSMGMAALKELLPPERLSRLSQARVADVGDGFTCADENMHPLFTIPPGNDAAVQLLRSELRNLLQEGIHIEWNKRLVHLEEKENKVIAHFADGTTATGDFLVGCDGGSSTVRELLPAHWVPKVVEVKRTVLGGQIDRTPEWDTLLPLNKNGFVRYVGPTDHSIGVCFSERSDRSPTVFWAVSKPTGIEDCKQLVESGPWHPHLKKLIQNTQPEEMMPPWVIRTTQFPDSVTYPMVPSGRMTLLGDAAHAMPPDRGLGGNNVLEDARLLSSLLASSTIDWPTVTANYEREMFERTKAAVQESDNAAAAFAKLRSLETDR